VKFGNAGDCYSSVSNCQQVHFIILNTFKLSFGFKISVFIKGKTKYKPKRNKFCTGSGRKMGYVW